MFIRRGRRYRAATRDEVLDAAAKYLLNENRGVAVTRPAEAVPIIQALCAGRDHEQFVVVLLDTRHRIIDCEALFRGTVDGTAVDPREVAKRALELNAAAVVLGHNHPSGDCEPSEADRTITARLSKALGLLDIRVLDHLVVNNSSFISLAEKGWI